MKRKRRRFAFWFAVLGCLLFTAAWVCYVPPSRQERLDQGLIRALNRGNTKAALALLNEGARANADESRPSLRDAGSLWAWLSPNFWYPHRTATKILVDSSYEVEDVPLVLAILKHGGNPNTTGRFGGVTLLYHASLRHFPQTVKALLEHGADPNRDTGQGYPLMVADAACSQLLLEHGAAVDAREIPELEPTPFAGALRDGDLAKAAVLRDHGASIPKLNAIVGKQTVLDGLAAVSDPKSVYRFLDWGAKVDSLDRAGATALMYAVNFGQLENASVLLEAHADVSIRNADGKTALDLANEALKEHRRAGAHDGPGDPYWRQIIALLASAEKHHALRHPRVQ